MEVPTQEGLEFDEVRQQLNDALDKRDAEHITDLAFYYPAWMARVIYELSPHHTVALVQLAGDQQLANVLANMDPTEAVEVLRRLTGSDAADILDEMDPDDATDVVEEFTPSEVAQILVEMEPAEAEHVRRLLEYPPQSAGGIMTPEFAAVSPSLTAEEAITAIRGIAAEAETVYYVYVIDQLDYLIGVLPLRALVLAPPTQLVADIMTTDVISVQVYADQEEAARTLQLHRLLALPVVDHNDRLLGIITADDVADILEEEATEDISRLGGSEPLEEPYLRASILDIARKRIGWLLFLFIGGAYSTTVLQIFEDEIAAVVALTFFIPILVGTGGNVGSQTVATIVRAMAVGEVAFTDLFRVTIKEAGVGLVMGMVLAVAMYIRAATLGVDIALGLVVGLAALFIVIWSATVAALLPMLLRRGGADPAIVSAPLITTLVDGTGLFIYFSVARLILGL